LFSTLITFPQIQGSHTVRSRKSAWGCGRRSQCPQRGCDAVLRARRCLTC